MPKGIVPLRARELAYCLCAVLVATLLLHAFLDADCSQLACRGDFPAFYTAAALAFDADLYQASRQQALQQEFWPSLKGAYLFFAYPPYTALLYSPLYLLPPLFAKLVLLVLSFGALYACARILAASEPDRFAWILLLLLAIPENFIALAAGQNLFFSLLLALLFIRSDTALVRGLVAAALWYKPQYGAAATLVLLFSADREALTYHLPAMGALFLAAVLQQGLGWPLTWLAALREFSAQEMVVNASRGISLSFWMAETLGLFMAVLVSGSLAAHLVWRSLLHRSRNTQVLWFLAALLLSPRSMFYDFGLCVLALPQFGGSTSRKLGAVCALTLLASCFSAEIEAFVLMLTVFSLYICLCHKEIRAGRRT